MTQSSTAAVPSTQTSFSFAVDLNVVFGLNRYKELPSLMKERGWARPGLVIDGSIVNSAPAVDLLGLLRNEFGSEIQTLETRTTGEPDYDYLDECADVFRTADIDCLIGVGGGSAMDVCKGICVLLKNPGKGIEYRGMNLVRFPSLPAILVPTTAGTGSEATFTAVFVDAANKTKMGINGRNVGCQLAVLDPAFTASCPRRVAVGAGLDAMVHSLEAFMTTRSNPIIFELGQLAWCHLFRAFPDAVNDPEAHEARLQMQIGSFLAGITLAYSGGGIAGALSYPLGGEFAVPHGLAGGLLIRYIISENLKRGYRDYAELYSRMFPEESGLSLDERCKRFHDRFVQMLAAIGAPPDFSGYSVRPSDIPRIIDQTLSQRSAVLKNNPIPVDEQLLTNILDPVVPRVEQLV